MSNPKVFEFAKEIGMTPLALMDKIKEWHLPVKNHMAELDPEVSANDTRRPMVIWPSIVVLLSIFIIYIIGL